MSVIKRHETGSIGNGGAGWTVRMLLVSLNGVVDLLGECMENRIVRFLNLGTIACRAVQLAAFLSDIVGFTV